MGNNFGGYFLDGFAGHIDDCPFGMSLVTGMGEPQVPLVT